MLNGTHTSTHVNIILYMKHPLIIFIDKFDPPKNLSVKLGSVGNFKKICSNSCTCFL